MLHEIVELVKGVAWPGVVFFFLVRFRPEIKQLLTELPKTFRRLRSAEGLGLKVELDVLDADLRVAQEETAHLELPAGRDPSTERGTK